jgi:hypothetical protein
MTNFISNIGIQEYNRYVTTTVESRSQKTDTQPKEKPKEVQDVVDISPDAKNISKTTNTQSKTNKQEEDLSSDEKKEVDQLKNRDREVRAHEGAHLAAGAGIVKSGAIYTYQLGPDGKMYAIGGEVEIDASPEKDPKATIQKMERVKRAALAPADPSSTDRAVAAEASHIEMEARSEASYVDTSNKTSKPESDSKNNVKESTGIVYSNSQNSSQIIGSNININI